MQIKYFDYSEKGTGIFYKVIYPMYAREFLFGNSYEYFIQTVEANFIINPDQRNNILIHWVQKERILAIETK